MATRLGAAALVAAVFFAAPALATAAPAKESFARAFVLEIDGVRRSEHAAERRLPPASLTKMMSGLLVIESGKADEAVRISRFAAAASGSRLRLKAGDRLLASDLLSAMLIASANDACRALAEWVAGSEARFVQRMNQRAETLGLSRTHFTNACGYDAPGHLSTANDLAMLARAAMAEPEYARRAGLAATRTSTIDGRKQFELSNHNHLIGRFAGAIGVKTGFTARAGKCLVALAERDGHQVLLVMLGAKNRWWDADAALDYGLRRADAQP